MYLIKNDNNLVITLRKIKYLGLFTQKIRVRNT